MNYKNIGNADFLKYSLKVNKVLNLNNKLTANVGGEGSIVHGDDIPETNIPAIGGIYNRQNSINFWGLEPSRYFSNKIESCFGQIFYEFNPSRYFLLRYNGAVIENEDNGKKYLHGGGVGIGADTMVGPIQFILSKSNKNSVIAYFNIGLNF